MEQFLKPLIFIDAFLFSAVIVYWSFLLFLPFLTNLAQYHAHYHE